MTKESIWQIYLGKVWQYLIVPKTLGTIHSLPDYLKPTLAAIKSTV